MSTNLEKYNASIKNRPFLKFVIGLVPRVFIYLKFAYIRWVARRMGGDCLKTHSSQNVS